MPAPLFEVADFVIITALEEERDAVLSKLDQPRRMPLSTEDTRTCMGAQLPIKSADGSEGIYNLIVQCLAGMGTIQAATAASDAVRRWKPTCVLMVGIAGGIAKNEAALGDVLVATQIFDYSQQKLTNESRQLRPEGYPVSQRLNEFAQSLTSPEWWPLIEEQRPAPGESKRRRGPMASASIIVEEEQLVEQLLGLHPKLIGVEMEAAGVVAAAAESVHKPDFFMVRGVSDLCDSDRSTEDVTSWRLYACDVAASYAIGLLKQGPVPPRLKPKPRRLARGLPSLPADDEVETDSGLRSQFNRQHATFVNERYHEACDYIEERLEAPTHDDKDLIRLYLQTFTPHRPHMVWSPQMSSGASWGDGIGEDSFNRLFVARRSIYPLSCVTPNLSDEEWSTSEIIIDLRQTKRIEEQTLTLEEAVSQKQNFVLLGAPGAGKTTNLRQLALDVLSKIYREVDDVKEEDGTIREVTVNAPDFLTIPILVELKRYNGEAELETLMARSINDVLKTQGESLGANDAQSVQKLKTWLLHPGAHFLLLFDGLNEVEGKYRIEARNALRSLLNYPQSVVVSCREHDYDGSLQELTTAYCLESLPDDAIRTFLGWFLEGKAPNIMWESGEALFRELESDERLLSLARNPLLLRLIGEVAWESPQTDLPANRARLFERFVKVMPQRRRQEGMDLGVPDYKVKVALRQLGLAMHEHDQLKADLEDVHRWLPQADDAFDLALRQAQEWRFLESDGGRGVEVEFIHPLFIEFFAADAMFERLKQSESLDSVVGQHNGDSRWHEVLLLLGGLMNEPQTLILWLTDEAQRTTNAQTALLANQLLLLMVLENAQKPSNSTSKSKPNATDEVDKGALDDAVLQAMLSVLNNPDNLEAFHTASIHENEYESWQQRHNDMTAVEQEVESHLNAGPQVVAMFMSGNERLMASADRILRRMKHPAVEPLLDVLENPQTDVDTRCRTIEVLAEIGDWRVSLREAAEVEKRPADGSKEDNRNGWQTVRVRCGTAEQLRQEDIEKERQLLLEMERCDKPHGLWQRRMTLLLQALHDSDPLIRVAAVQALA